MFGCRLVRPLTGSDPRLRVRDRRARGRSTMAALKSALTTRLVLRSTLLMLLGHARLLYISSVALLDFPLRKALSGCSGSMWSHRILNVIRIGTAISAPMTPQIQPHNSIERKI